jgi:hypothetical protein
MKSALINDYQELALASAPFTELVCDWQLACDGQLTLEFEQAVSTGSSIVSICRERMLSIMTLVSFLRTVSDQSHQELESEAVAAPLLCE